MHFARGTFHSRDIGCIFGRFRLGIMYRDNLNNSNLGTAVLKALLEGGIAVMINKLWVANPFEALQVDASISDY